MKVWQSVTLVATILVACAHIHRAAAKGGGNDAAPIGLSTVSVQIAPVDAEAAMDAWAHLHPDAVESEPGLVNLGRYEADLPEVTTLRGNDPRLNSRMLDAVNTPLEHSTGMPLLRAPWLPPIATAAGLGSQGISAEIDGALPGLASGPSSALGFQSLQAYDSLTSVDAYAWPHRMNVHLFIDWRDGHSTLCSGVLIGGNDVLTAGHCVFDHNHDGWARQIYAVAGNQGNGGPVGGAWSTRLMTWSNWTAAKDFNSDMGVIALDRPTGYWVGGWHGLRVASCYEATQWPSNNTGWPGYPYTGAQLYHRFGSADECTTDDIVSSYNTSYGGMSGGPEYFYFSSADQRATFAVLSHTRGGGGITGFVRVNDQRFHDILDFTGRD